MVGLPLPLHQTVLGDETILSAFSSGRGSLACGTLQPSSFAGSDFGIGPLSSMLPDHLEHSAMRRLAMDDPLPPPPPRGGGGRGVQRRFNQRYWSDTGQETCPRCSISMHLSLHSFRNRG